MSNKEILFGDPKWMFESVFTSEYTQDAVTQNKTLEEFLNDAPVQYNYACSDTHKYLFSKVSYATGVCHSATGLEIVEISNLEAFNLFGIRCMETASEKSYCKVEKSYKVKNS